jgi:hypothetical protein
MTQFRTRSTSLMTTVIPEIVLRDGERTRLVFLPVLVENNMNRKAGVKGDFVYQRKLGKDVWVPIRTVPLSSLKAGEGYALNLSSNELLQLFEKLKDIYEFREEVGVPRGEATWIKAPYKAIAENLDQDSGDAEAFLSNVIKWMATSPQAITTIQRMMGTNQLPDLNARLGLASLKATVAAWEANKNNKREVEFWQKFLEERTYVICQILAFPVVVIQAQAYLGGTKVDDKGGKYTDFLMSNVLTRGTVVVEIKTPKTDLLGNEYRKGVRPFSTELSGAIAQVLQQRHIFVSKHLPVNHEPELTSAGICCFVIAGNTEQLADNALKDCFEMQRQSLHGVTILTFDELFRRVKDLIRLIETPAPSSFGAGRVNG